jgi:hypothetical protein
MEIKTPANRALAVLNTPPMPEAAIPAKRISAKVRSGIDAMVTGECKTIKDAAEKAGLSREHFTRELSKPHIAEHLRQKVLRSLAIAAARAGAVKGELLDSPDSMARDRASTFVLGTAGIGPATAPSLSINLEIRAGYVIDISDEPPSALRVISP